MHIEPSDNLINGPANGGFGWYRIGQVASTAARADNARLQNEYSGYITQAQQTQGSDLPSQTQALQDVRKALEAGEFDKPEAFLAAAVNMLMVGI